MIARDEAKLGVVAENISTLIHVIYSAFCPYYTYTDTFSYHVTLSDQSYSYISSVHGLVLHHLRVYTPPRSIFHAD